ncbi:hypothetical protein ERJ75_000274000 [Trypanosoma vivax]|nr:hypothetical protein ERJ75_000274000 [Trypanosoma vivax]
MLAPADAEERVRTLEERVAALEADLAAAAAERDEAVARVREADAREAGFGADACEDADLRAANAMLMEEVRELREQREALLATVTQEASERIAEHDELLRQKLEEERAALEADFAERVRALEAGAAGQQQQQQYGSAQAANPFASLPGPAGRLFGAACGSGVEDDSDKALCGAMLAPADAEERVRTLEERVAALEADLAAAAAERDEAVARVREADAREAGFGADACEDADLRAANAMLMEEVRELREQREALLATVTQEASERIAEHDELLRQKLEEERAALEADFAERVRALEAGAAGQQQQQQQQQYGSAQAANPFASLPGPAGRLFGAACGSGVEDDSDKALCGAMLAPADAEERVRTLEERVAALEADLAAAAAERDEAVARVREADVREADAREAGFGADACEDADLRAANAMLMEEVRELREQREALLATVTQEASERIAEHDELLRQKLEEERAALEADFAERVRALEAGAAGQQQQQYGSAQAANPFASLPGPAGRLFGAACGSGVEDDSDKALCGAMLAPADAEERVRTLEERVAALEADLAAAAAERDEAVARVREADAREAGFGADACEDADLRAANAMLMEEVRELREQREALLATVTQEASERIAEHDELLRQKLEEERAALEADFAERVRALEAGAAGQQQQQQYGSAQAANPFASLPGPAGRLFGAACGSGVEDDSDKALCGAMLAPADAEERVRTLEERVRALEAGAAGQQQQQQYGSAQAANPFASLPGPAGRLFGAACGSGVEDDSDKALCGAMLAPADAEERVRTLEERVAALEADLAAAAAERDEAVARVREADAREAGFGADACEDADLRAANAMLMEEVRELREQREALLATVTQEASERIAEHDELLRQKLEEERAALEADFAERVRALEAGAAGQQQQQQYGSAQAANPFASLPGPAGRLFGAACGSGVEDDSDKALCGAMLAPADAEERVRTLEERVAALEADLAAAAAERDEAVARVREADAREAGFGADACEDADLRAANAMLMEEVRELREQREALLATVTQEASERIAEHDELLRQKLEEERAALEADFAERVRALEAGAAGQQQQQQQQQYGSAQAANPFASLPGPAGRLFGAACGSGVEDDSDKALCGAMLAPADAEERVRTLEERVAALEADLAAAAAERDEAVARVREADVREADAREAGFGADACEDADLRAANAMLMEEVRELREQREALLATVTQEASERIAEHDELLRQKLEEERAALEADFAERVRALEAGAAGQQQQQYGSAQAANPFASLPGPAGRLFGAACGSGVEDDSDKALCGAMLAPADAEERVAALEADLAAAAAERDEAVARVREADAREAGFGADACEDADLRAANAMLMEEVRELREQREALLATVTQEASERIAEHDELLRQKLEEERAALEADFAERVRALEAGAAGQQQQQQYGSAQAANPFASLPGPAGRLFGAACGSGVEDDSDKALCGAMLAPADAEERVRTLEERVAALEADLAAAAAERDEAVARVREADAREAGFGADACEDADLRAANAMLMEEVRELREQREALLATVTQEASERIAEHDELLRQKLEEERAALEADFAERVRALEAGAAGQQQQQQYGSAQAANPFASLPGPAGRLFGAACGSGVEDDSDKALCGAMLAPADAEERVRTLEERVRALEAGAAGQQQQQQYGSAQAANPFASLPGPAGRLFGAACGSGVEDDSDKALCGAMLAPADAEERVRTLEERVAALEADLAAAAAERDEAVARVREADAREAGFGADACEDADLRAANAMLMEEVRELREQREALLATVTQEASERIAEHDELLRQKLEEERAALEADFAERVRALEAGAAGQQQQQQHGSAQAANPFASLPGPAGRLFGAACGSGVEDDSDKALCGAMLAPADAEERVRTLEERVAALEADLAAAAAERDEAVARVREADAREAGFGADACEDADLRAANAMLMEEVRELREQREALLATVTQEASERIAEHDELLRQKLEEERAALEADFAERVRALEAGAAGQQQQQQQYGSAQAANPFASLPGPAGRLFGAACGSGVEDDSDKALCGAMLAPADAEERVRTLEERVAALEADLAAAAAERDEAVARVREADAREAGFGADACEDADLRAANAMLMEEVRELREQREALLATVTQEASERIAEHDELLRQKLEEERAALEADFAERVRALEAGAAGQQQQQQYGSAQAANPFASLPGPAGRLFGAACGSGVEDDSDKALCGAMLAPADAEERVRTLEERVAALEADLAAAAAERDEAVARVREADAREAGFGADACEDADLRAANAMLMEEVRELREQREALLATVTQEASERIAEHDELLRQKLEEERAALEADFAERVRALEAGAAGQQQQQQYGSAQAANPFASLPGPAGRLFGAACGSGVEDDSDKALCGAMLAPADAEERVRTLEERVAALEADLAAAAAERDEAVARVREADAREAGFGADACEDADLRAANAMLMEEVRELREQREALLATVTQEASERIAEHDELLRQKLEEERAALEADFAERVRALEAGAAGQQQQQQYGSAQAANPFASLPGPAGRLFGAACGSGVEDDSDKALCGAMLAPADAEERVRTLEERVRALEAGAAGQQQQQQYGSAQAANPFASLPGPAGRLFGAACGSGVEDDSDKALCGAMLAPADAEERVRTLEERVAALEADLAAAAAERDEAVARVREADAREAGFGADACEDADLRAANAMLMEEVRELREQREALLATVTQEASERIAEHDELLRQKLEEERAALEADFAERVRALEAGAAGQQQQQYGSAQAANPFASLPGPAGRLFGAACGSGVEDDSDKALCGAMLAPADAEERVRTLEERVAALEADLAAAAAERDEAVARVREADAREAGFGADACEDADLRAANAMLMEEVRELREQREALLATVTQEASERIAEHDELLRQKLEEERAALEADFAERVRALEAGAAGQQQQQQQYGSAQAANPFASLPGPAGRLFGAACGSGVEDDSDKALCGAMLAPADAEERVRTLEERVAALEADLAAAAAERDEAVARVREADAREAGFGADACEDADLRAANAMLMEEVRELREQREALLATVTQEASERIAEHDELLRQKLEEERAALEADFAERVRALEAGAAGQQQQQQYGSAQAANPFASLPGPAGRLFGAACGSGVEDDSDKALCGAMLAPADAEERVRTLEERVAALEADLAAAAAERDEAVARVREADAREAGFGADACEDADLRAANAMLMEEVRELREQREALLATVTQEASERIAEHDELLRQKLEEERAALEADFAERVRALEAGAAGQQQQQQYGSAQAANPFASLPGPAGRLFGAACGSGVEDDSDKALCGAMLAPADAEERVRTLEERVAALEADLAAAAAERDEAVARVREADAREAGFGADACEDADLRAANAMLMEEVRELREQREALLATVTQEASERIAEHDELLRQKLEEERAALEADFAERVRALEAGAAGQQQQQQYGSAQAANPFASLPGPAGRLFGAACGSGVEDDSDKALCGAMLAPADAEERVRTLEERVRALEAGAAGQQQQQQYGSAQAANPFASLPGPAGRLFGAACGSGVEDDSDKALCGAMLAPADAEERVRTLEERVAALEADLAAAAAERDEAVARVREADAREAGFGADACEDADLRAANAMLMEEVRELREQREALLATVTQEASERIAEHDELLRQKLEEERAALEADFAERVRALEAGAAGQQQQQQQQQYGSAQAANPFASLPGPAGRLFGAACGSGVEDDSDKALCGAMLAPADAEERVRTLEERVAALEADLAAAAAERDEAVARVREADAREAGFGADACEDADLRAANAMLMEEVRELREQREALLATVTQEASERIAEHDELLRQKLIEREMSYANIFESFISYLSFEVAYVDDLSRWKYFYYNLCLGFYLLKRDLNFVSIAKLLHTEVAIFDVVHDNGCADLRTFNADCSVRSSCAVGPSFTSSPALAPLRGDVVDVLSSRDSPCSFVVKNAVGPSMCVESNDVPVNDGVVVPVSFSASFSSLNDVSSGVVDNRFPVEPSELIRDLSEVRGIADVLSVITNDLKRLNQVADDFTVTVSSDAVIALPMLRDGARDYCCSVGDGVVARASSPCDVAGVLIAVCQSILNELIMLKKDFYFFVADRSELLSGSLSPNHSCADMSMGKMSMLNPARPDAVDMSNSSMLFCLPSQLLADSVLFEKLLTIPTLVGDLVSASTSLSVDFLSHLVATQHKLLMHCDVVERSASEAIVEGERQCAEFSLILENMQVERQELLRQIACMQEEAIASRAITEAAKLELQQTNDNRRVSLRVMQEELASAKRDVEALQLERCAALHRIELLKSENANLSSLFEEIKKTAEDVETEQQREVARLQEALREKARLSREMLQSTEEQIAKAVEQAERSGLQREQAEKQARSVQSTLDRVLPRLEQLEEERCSLEGKLMDTSQRLNELVQCSRTAEEVSRRRVESLSSRVEELTKANSTLRENSAAQQDLVDSLRVKLDESESELARLRARMAQQDGEAQRLRGQLSDLESLHARQAEDSSVALHACELRIVSLESRNATLKEELQQQQQQYCTLRERCDDVEQKLWKASESHQTMEQQQKRRVQQLTERTEALHKEHKQLLEAYTSLMAERDAIAREHASDQQSMKRSGRRLERVNQQNEQLKAELQRQRESHEAEMHAARIALDGAHGELVKWRASLEDAEKSKGLMRDAMQVLQQEKAVYEEEVKVLRLVLRDYERASVVDGVIVSESLTRSAVVAGGVPYHQRPNPTGSSGAETLPTTQTLSLLTLTQELERLRTQAAVDRETISRLESAGLGKAVPCVATGGDSVGVTDPPSPVHAAPVSGTPPMQEEERAVQLSKESGDGQVGPNTTLISSANMALGAAPATLSSEVAPSVYGKESDLFSGRDGDDDGAGDSSGSIRSSDVA